MNNLLIDHQSWTELAIICVLGIAFLGSMAWQRYQRNKPMNDITNTSMLISMYSLGTILSNLKSGTLDGYNYHLLITEPAFSFEVSAKLAGRIIIAFDLPFTSPVHLAGFGLIDKSFKSALNNTDVDNSMTRVELEGDFPDYFRLYCQPGHEIELREVLDPTAMQFLVDYCKRMQWEIIDTNLYFAQSAVADDETDSETAFVDAQSFIAKILPAIQKL